MTILYEDRDIIVIDKSGGLLTVSNDRTQDKTAYFLLTDYVRKGNYKSRNRVFIVHRLDRETSGLLVFARTAQAKAYLQDNWQSFSKKYLAVVQGIMDAKEGLISSYLTENSAHKVYSVKDPAKGRLAKTAYRVVNESNERSLLEIELLTGRKHQIRVHLAEQGHPVIGDRRYGEPVSGSRLLALQACSLTIRHPFSKKEMTFTVGQRLKMR